MFQCYSYYNGANTFYLYHTLAFQYDNTLKNTLAVSI